MTSSSSPDQIWLQTRNSADLSEEYIWTSQRRLIEVLIFWSDSKLLGMRWISSVTLDLQTHARHTRHERWAQRVSDSGLVADSLKGASNVKLDCSRWYGSHKPAACCNNHLQISLSKANYTKFATLELCYLSRDLFTRIVSHQASKNMQDSFLIFISPLSQAVPDSTILPEQHALWQQSMASIW